MANKKYTKKQSKKKSGGHSSNSNANAKPNHNHEYYQESSSDDESYYHCEHAIAEHIFECFVRHKIAEKLHEQMFDQVTVTVLIYLFFTFTIGLLFSFFFMISILNYLASSGIGLVCFAAAWLFSVYSEYDLTVFTRVPSQLAIVIYLFLFRFTLAHTYILDYLGGNELIYQFVSSIFRIIVTLAIMMNLVSGMQMLKGGPSIEHVHPLNCNRTQVVLSILLTGERETVAELVPHIPTREELHEQAAREKFVNNVYAILAVSLTITVANGMLTLLFVSSTMESHYAEALSTVVYLSILLTFFFWVIISFVCHRTTLDYTVHKLFIWCFQLVWLFVFALLFTLSGMGSYIIAWSTLGLVVNLLALLVDTQMIIGGAKLWRKFDTSQLILATLTLFWDLLMIFVLQMPLLGSLITMIMGYFEDF